VAARLWVVPFNQVAHPLESRALTPARSIIVNFIDTHPPLNDDSAPRTRRLAQYRLFTNALALLVSVAGSGILGLVYWDIAAHLTSQEVIGRATAEIAAVTLLSSLAQLSWGSVFQRFLPEAGEGTKLFVLRGYAISSVLGAVLAVSYVLVGFTHRFYAPSVRWDLLFVAFVVGYTIFTLQDSVLVSLRVSRWVAVENNLFGLAKLALLFSLATYATGQGLIYSWMGPLLLTVIVVNWYIFGSRIPHHVRTGPAGSSLPSIRRILSLAVPQFVATLLSSLSISGLALVVETTLGNVANADYFLVAQVAYAPSMFLWSVTRILIVESSHEPTQQRRHATQAALALGGILVLSMGAGIVLAHPLLTLFGHSYASQGTTLLRLMLLALPGTAMASLYAGFAWLDGRVWGLLWRQATTVGFLFLAVVLFIRGHGINTIGDAYVATGVLELLLFGPGVLRRFRVRNGQPTA